MLLFLKEWVDSWYEVMDEYNKTDLESSNCTNRRKLFIASDELKDVVKEAKIRWGNKYEIYHGPFNTKSMVYKIIKYIS
uniref:Uncharacterized protein n=1 Tax=Meloidogyne incognita TaxID=6306 RepID=A0A914L210_MELIC